MIVAEAVRQALGVLSECDPADNGVWVTTSCLYPSNASVRVLVTGGHAAYVVSDAGGAVHDAGSSGLRLTDPERRLKHIVQRYGLKLESGVIYSPSVPLEGLASGIVLVANASKECSQWAHQHFHFDDVKNFKEELAKIIDRVRDHKVEHDGHLVGASNKTHKFDHIIKLSDRRLVVIDPVMRDASSINAKVVAHLDIKNAQYYELRQRLVFDDRENWPASDINLLRVGAKPVPFTQVAGVLPRLMA